MVSSSEKLTDAQFSVIAVATPGKPSVVIDRVAYTPYGEPTRTLRSDVNGDGVVNKDDYNTIIQPLIGTAIGSSGYVVEADLDRDGKISSDDYDVCIADDGQKSGGGVGEAGLFSAGVRSSVGYCGYIHNEDTGLYTVRYRTYSATLGRWLTKDPAGYVDGMSLYQFVGGQPTFSLDPLGWCKCEPPTQPEVTQTSGVDQPSRDTVFDFDTDWFTPVGTKNVKTWAELVKILKQRINDGKAGTCWTISGHGSSGNFNPAGAANDGRTQVSIDQNTIQYIKSLLANQEKCALLENNNPEMVAEYRALLEFIELARTHLANGGTLEFGGCNSGAGQSGKRLGESLARELRGVRILLYDKTVGWYPGPFFLWRHLVNMGGKDGKTAKDVYKSIGDSAKPTEYLCKPDNCDKKQDGAKQEGKDGK